MKERFINVFVTGATGFIASSIVRELLTARHPVLGYHIREMFRTLILNVQIRVHIKCQKNR